MHEMHNTEYGKLYTKLDLINEKIEKEKKKKEQKEKFEKDIKVFWSDLDKSLIDS